MSALRRPPRYGFGSLSAPSNHNSVGYESTPYDDATSSSTMASTLPSLRHAGRGSESAAAAHSGAIAAQCEHHGAKNMTSNCGCASRASVKLSPPRPSTLESVNSRMLPTGELPSGVSSGRVTISFGVDGKYEGGGEMAIGVREGAHCVGGRSG